MPIEYMVYADGDYYSSEEYDEHPSYKSDDFYILEVPEDVDVDEFITEYLTAVDLGVSCEQRQKGL